MTDQPIARRRGRPRKQDIQAKSPITDAMIVEDVVTSIESPGSVSISPEIVSSFVSDMRPDMRNEQRMDPREAAAIRAAEIMSHLGDIDQGTDEFYVDPTIIPDGWVYNWKRETVYGQSDPTYQVSLARTGWTAVPTSRHPEMMPQGTEGPIRRKGAILMERPKVIDDQFVELDLRRARERVKMREAQLGQAPQGQFERSNKDAPMAKISKSYEPMPVPDDRR